MPDHDVAPLDAVPPGQLHGVMINGQKIVLANVGGAIHALDGVCPHYGAPLDEGCLIGDRLFCPWHQGCFAATTGELLDPPPLDALAHYAVRVAGGRVIVTVPATLPAAPRDPIAAVHDQPGAAPSVAPAHIAIVGGGAAGYAAAQRLRELRYAGQITMISDDPHDPYDRPACSKSLLTGELASAEATLLRPESFYEKHRIARIHERVTAVDAATRTISFAGRAPLSADRILLATGGRARRPELPGMHLPSVFVLRTLNDATALIARATASTARRAVLVGGSFIALEVAAALVQRGLEVTVLLTDAVPFQKTLGPEIGAAIQAVHQKHGVRFQTATRVTKILGDADVRAVECHTGATVDADLVVLGMGTDLNTGMIRGLDLADDHSVPVGATLETRSPGVFAAGDIARIKHPHFAEPLRIEHWRFALQQGRAAAENMLGRSAPLAATPYFWTFQFDFGLDMLGHARQWDRIHWDGRATDNEFLAYYIRDERVIAVAGRNRSAAISVLLRLFDTGRVPTAQHIQALRHDQLKTLLR